MKIHEIRRFWSLSNIERTEMVSIVTTDWIVTCFGNDEQFLTFLSQSAASGHRTVVSYCSSLRKVLPAGGVINGVINVTFRTNPDPIRLNIVSFVNFRQNPELCCTLKFRYDSFVSKNRKIRVFDVFLKTRKHGFARNDTF